MVGGFDVVTVEAPEPVPDQVDGEIGHVDPHPATVEGLGCRDGRAAAAERVEHHVTLVAGRGDDAFKAGAPRRHGACPRFAAGRAAC
jgi:hypothetical protein